MRFRSPRLPSVWITVTTGRGRSIEAQQSTQTAGTVREMNSPLIFQDLIPPGSKGGYIVIMDEW